MTESWQCVPTDNVVVTWNPVTDPGKL